MKKNAPKRRIPVTCDTAARLEKLLHTAGGTIPYHENLPDKEYPRIKWSVYGAPKTNELFVKLTDGTKTFVETVQSPLVYPAMGDRIFGMDVSDVDAAFHLSDCMWDKYRSFLALNEQ